MSSLVFLLFFFIVVLPLTTVIKDNNDQLYFESQVYRVYDLYHVVICHHCQKMGHMASKCPDKNDGRLNPQSVERVRVHTKHENVMK